MQSRISPSPSQALQRKGSAVTTPATERGYHSARQLLYYPTHVRYSDEPWYSLWSSLCHQQDIYSASLAAVPHIVTLVLAQPWRIDYNYLALPACIEIGRHRDGVPADTPTDVLRWHDAAIAKLPKLVAACDDSPWTPAFTHAACGALAVAKGHWRYAEEIIAPQYPNDVT